MDISTACATYIEANRSDSSGSSVVLNDFSSWCARRQFGSIDTLSHKVIDRYLAEYGRWYRPDAASIHRVRGIITKFFEYLQEQENIPTSQLRKETKIGINHLQVDEIERILTACNDYARTMILLLIETGMRAGELADLRWQDVNLDQVTLRVRTRSTNGDRLVAISKKISNALAAVYQSGKAMGSEPTFVFCKRNGDGYTTQEINRHMRYVSQNCGVDFSTHILRKFCLYQCLKNGMPIEILAKQTGIRTETILRYVGE